MHRAFTLIELLVVISIIALLIALILPALGAARATAQMTMSTANAQQIVFAMHAYAQDNRSTLPFSRNINNAYWGGILYVQGYVSDAKIFWSAGRDSSNLNFATMLKVPSYLDWKYTGYAVNQVGAMPRETTPPQNPYYQNGSPLRLDVFGNPPAGKHVLMNEMFLASIWTSEGKDGTHEGGTSSDYVCFTYMGKLVRGYVDGHALARDGADLGWQEDGPRSGYWTIPNRLSAPWYDFRPANYWTNW